MGICRSLCHSFFNFVYLIFVAKVTFFPIKFYKKIYFRYPDNCPPRKIVPWLGLEFGSGWGLVLGLGEMFCRNISTRKLRGSIYYYKIYAIRWYIEIYRIDTIHENRIMRYVNSCQKSSFQKKLIAQWLIPFQSLPWRFVIGQIHQFKSHQRYCEIWPCQDSIL